MTFSRGDPRLWWFSRSIKPFWGLTLRTRNLFCEKKRSYYPFSETNDEKTVKNWPSPNRLLITLRGIQNQKLTNLGGRTHPLLAGNATPRFLKLICMYVFFRKPGQTGGQRGRQPWCSTYRLSLCTCRGLGCLPAGHLTRPLNLERNWWKLELTNVSKFSSRILTPFSRR